MIILLIAAYFGLDLSGHKQSQSPSSTIPAAQRNETTFLNNGVDTVKAAYEQRQSNVQVQGRGRVKTILRDDNDGSRHQKFILVLKNGLSILVAHNIDLAPKISNLNKGDIVEFMANMSTTQKVVYYIGLITIHKVVMKVDGLNMTDRSINKAHVNV